MYISLQQNVLFRTVSTTELWGAGTLIPHLYMESQTGVTATLGQPACLSFHLDASQLKRNRLCFITPIPHCNLRNSFEAWLSSQSNKIQATIPCLTTRSTAAPPPPPAPASCCGDLCMLSESEPPSGRKVQCSKCWSSQCSLRPAAGGSRHTTRSSRRTSRRTSRAEPTAHAIGGSWVTATVATRAGLFSPARAP